MIQVDVALPLARFPLRVAARFETGAVAVLGASGSGKTSLLEVIAGLRRGASGRVVLEETILMDSSAGVWLPPEERRIGYVPQDACLFPHLDVARNVRFGLKGGSEAEKLFAEAVAILEIHPLLSRFPVTLSGGERQRVALARAIATSPRLLLLDEPLAAVDVELKERILPYLLRAREALDIPFLYVTHNAGEAGAIAREAILLHQGAAVLQGRADEVLRSRTLPQMDPETRFDNILAGTLEPDAGSGETAVLRTGEARLVVPLAAGTPAPARVIYAVSPEDILVSTQPPEHVSARNVLRGKVVSATASETGAWIRVAAAGVEWTVRLTRSAAEELRLSPGVSVWLAVKTHAFRPLR